MSEWKKRTITSWVVSLISGIATFLLVLLLRKDFSLTGFCDASFFAGMVVLGVLLMYIVERSGTFDVFNFQFYRFFESFRPDGLKKWDTAYDYKRDKESKRKRSKFVYLPYLVVLGAFLLTALVLLIIVEIQIKS